MKIPQVWNTAPSVQLLSDRADFHQLITTYSHLIYCHLCIYLGTFNVNEGSRWETLRREGREEAGVLIFGGNEDWSGLCKWMLQEFTDEYLIKKPLGHIWPSPKCIIKDTLIKRHITDLTCVKMPWRKPNIFSVNPTCCPTYQRERKHTHVFFKKGNKLFQRHSFSIAAAEKAQLTSRMIHLHRLGVNQTWGGVCRGLQERRPPPREYSHFQNTSMQNNWE